MGQPEGGQGRAGLGGAGRGGAAGLGLLVVKPPRPLAPDLMPPATLPTPPHSPGTWSG